MEAMLKKFQQKYRTAREEMNRWDELQTQFLKQFMNTLSVIERLPVLGDKNNYGGLAKVPGITNALLGKQMESLERLFYSMNETIKGFHRIVTSLEKIMRDGNQFLKGGSMQLSKQQMQLRVGIRPTLSQCVDGLRTLYEMHHSEYLVKSSAVSALSLKSSANDMRALHQLLADQPNIPKDEVQFIFNIIFPEDICC
ncbi:hypothetical protein H6P81_010814 [Aristolochia fimbriata]|uniref:Uncharacterized protein n=1 Tax=Aristolochia fimbriata TaxID=158543 RepID=A0AAV7EQZ8_ARIFI|nr:hypothetical protein H6P81_010814 [Aristolochia fimbriata]